MPIASRDCCIFESQRPRNLLRRIARAAVAAAVLTGPMFACNSAHAQLLVQRDDTFVTAPLYWHKWTPTSGNLSYDANTGSLRIFIPTGPVQRINGWRESEYWFSEYDPSNYPDHNELMYEDIGPGNWIRAKFHIFAQAADGSANVGALNQMPSPRLRISAPFFSFGSFVDIEPHNSHEPVSNAYALDMSPTTSPLNPRVYRVDMDPPEFSWEAGHPGTIFKSHVDSPDEMGFIRMFEAYSRASEPQEQGYLCLAETSIGTYPAVPDASFTTIHTYGLDPRDWTTPGVTGQPLIPGSSYTTAEVWEQANGAPFGSAPIATSVNGGANPNYPFRPRASDIVFAGSPSGFYMDTIAVDNRPDVDGSGKYAVATVDWYYGNANATDLTRARIMPATLYRTRFIAGSTVSCSVQAMLRFRCSGINSQYNARLEIGGSTGGGELSWGYLPGPGSAWAPSGTGIYDLIFTSPMEINPMDMNQGSGPHLGALPGQGQPDPTLYGYWRELHPGVDILDEFISDMRMTSERSKGQITINSIQIQSTPMIE